MPAAPSPVRHRLEQSLILLDDYLHPLFGAAAGDPRPFLSLKRQLGEGLAEGYDANGRSYLAARLAERFRGAPADLWAYDDNIKRHLDAINAARPQDEQIVLKYFQHLALFYTEHVLHRLFTGLDAFVAELNTLVAARNAKERRAGWHFAPYTVNDLTKLAFWMATGSGKTLLLHINYHQIRHYAGRARTAPYDNILLITPNAGLSLQHLQEFELSGIPAAPFRTGAKPGGDVVQVIEITKFTTGAKGPQTVAVTEFEGRNLVFVDEGHRGASGDVWVGYRDALASDGFTFEYSATFGEALNKGSSTADIRTRQNYGKSIVFDYSYRYFYRDGCGKDYALVNLPRGYQADQQDTLLLANLLTFCQQMEVFATDGGLMRTYNLERPLLMFVGHTVQTGKKRSEITGEDRQSLSDVLDIVRFLHRVASDPAWAQETIARIFAGTAGLKDATGRDLFANSFPYLPDGAGPAGLAAAATYTLLLKHIFHAGGPGALHLARLRLAPGEISLRLGTADLPFGVINIGDDSNFVAMAQEAALGLVFDNEDAFRKSLFETINQTGSTVNILVGAKKFTEGWSSWRVSGMGLLNVGRSEGSEVIQMFGRGVRLLGYARSLQRSTALEGSHPPVVGVLEKLNIFSINGDYLAEFRASLDREGIVHDVEEIHVPVQFNFLDAPEQLAGETPGEAAGSPPLYVIRLPQDADFGRQPGFALRLDKDVRAEIDLRMRLEVESSQAAAGGSVHTDDVSLVIPAHLLDLLDWDALALDMLVWRRQRGFGNLAIDRAVLRGILSVAANGRDTPYYILRAPSSLIAPRSYAALGELQAAVLAILRKYVERFYFLQKRLWDSRHLEYRVLDRSDPNLQLVLHENRPPATWSRSVATAPTWWSWSMPWSRKGRPSMHRTRRACRVRYAAPGRKSCPASSLTATSTNRCWRTASIARTTRLSAILRKCPRSFPFRLASTMAKPALWCSYVRRWPAPPARVSAIARCTCCATSAAAAASAFSRAIPPPTPSTLTSSCGLSPAVRRRSSSSTPRACATCPRETSTTTRSGSFASCPLPCRTSPCPQAGRSSWTPTSSQTKATTKCAGTLATPASRTRAKNSPRITSCFRMGQ